MSAVKRSQSQQQRFFYPQQKTVDLTQQERHALSLVWRDEEDTNPVDSQQDGEMDHCAELGYN